MNGTTNTKDIEKGQELYDAVKAGFILRGTTLATWCRNNGMLAANARQALMGSWAGPAAHRLVSKMVAASQADQLLTIKKDVANA